MGKYQNGLIEVWQSLEKGSGRVIKDRRTGGNDTGKEPQPKK